MNDVGKYLSNAILLLVFFFVAVIVINPSYLQKIGKFLSGEPAVAAASPTPAPPVAVATPVPTAPPAAPVAPPAAPAVAPAAPTPRPVVKHFAPAGVYYLVERVSIPTDSGIVGMSPGTKVTFVNDTGTKWVVTDGKVQFEVSADQVTNDLDVAKVAFANDQTLLKAVADGIHKQEEATRKAQDEANARHSEAMKQVDARPATQTTAYVNPLEKPAYNQRYSPNYGYYGYYPYSRSSYYNYYGYSSGPYYDQWGNRYYLNGYGNRVYY